MAANSVFTRTESRVASYCRSFPRVFARASGSEIYDVDGNRYLDFLAGCGSLNYGHNHPVLKEALLEYIISDNITQSLDLYSTAKERFLLAMEEWVLSPLGLDHVVQFTGPTGTNAVEAAFKLARKVTGRCNIISFTNGFHGVSLGALAATGNQYNRQAAGIPLIGMTSLPYDGYFGEAVDTVAYFEQIIDDPSSGVDLPAAVVLETVQGEGGLNCASMQWLSRLRTACTKRGILMIVDDIQAGCGRTGTFLSFEPAQIKPDIITLSKSISGYGLPFSCVLIERSLDLWKPAEHNGTFRGNNHAFVTAATALEHFWSSPDFAIEICNKGTHLNDRLDAIATRFADHIIDVRGRGMMQGLRFADADMAAHVGKLAFENGLIIERSGAFDEVIKCMMPLTTTMTELNEGLDILEHCISKVFASVRQTG